MEKALVFLNSCPLGILYPFSFNQLGIINLFQSNVSP